jgi:hypothetical protein
MLKYKNIMSFNTKTCKGTAYKHRIHALLMVFLILYINLKKTADFHCNFFLYFVAITDEGIQELNGFMPQAAVLTSFDAAACSDTDTASETGEDLPEPLTALYDPNARKLSEVDLLRKCSSTFDNFNKLASVDQLDSLEAVTKEQSKCQAWHVHRMGRITSTICHRIATMREDTCPSETVAAAMHYKDKDLNTAATRWGVKNEANGRDFYKQVMRKHHDDFQVKLSGLVIRRDALHLGASPDGIVSCSCCGSGVLEIKCPHKYQYGFEGALGDRNFCLDENFELKRKHRYFFQIQHQMYVCDVQYCDFVVWTESAVSISRVTRDDSLLERLLPKMQSFFLQYILPEIITRRNDPQIKDSVTCYICDRPEFGKMIKCANCENDFHYECVHINRKCKGWMCATCKKSK